MTPEDLAALHARCFGVAPRPWTVQEFRDMRAAPGMIFVEVPGGFAMARRIADEAELLTIAVAPEARQQGLGGQLLSACEGEAARLGAWRMLLEVADDNRAALALYERAGYREAGYRKDYYKGDGRRASARVLVKDLARD